MPVHMISSQADDTSFVDGLPVGFSAFEPESGVDLLDPPATEDQPSWSEIATPLAARDEEDYDDEDDDDDDDIWDDDDDDDDDDDLEDDDEDDFDDDDDDPLTFDDDDDEF
ncbi:MAG: hypothetical protein ACNA8P_03905 [Phycisphaerales bacterium]